MTRLQRATKRTCDIAISAFGLAIASPLIIAAIIAARWDTRASGLFRQVRVGLHGKPFTLFKIRTMRIVPNFETTVTTDHDQRITRLGMLFRKLKIDELPQLFNVLRGDMSLVGPRPDVPSQIAELDLEVRRDFEQIVCSVRPGITGPASIKYRNEETILAAQEDPDEYNRAVIFPDKVRINCDYVRNYRFTDDLKSIWQTIAGTRLPLEPPSAPAREAESDDGASLKTAA